MRPANNDTKRKNNLFLITIFCTYGLIYSQTNNIEHHKIGLGFIYGQGAHKSFPSPSKSYNFRTKFYKLHLNYKLTNKRYWALAVNLEPSYYINEHKSLGSVQHVAGKIAESTTRPEDVINEYALNIGIQAKYNLFKNLTSYFLGSIGPTFSNMKTERLNKGFAFSNIVAMGLNYNINLVLLDFRLSMRHVSNAGMNYPNRGYNSLNFEVGFTIPLKTPTIY
ncbi:acyloxyacyl hydrolase [Seonamhaeicola sp.]|uniref:acyloxyacyl hydrolase n=1 Tax=Seonamhaeicola sp. TaxID=1912245 RepID=UPI002613FFB5|nr:acyloxyacyl hydrolase [Seonamhaeicola sp.]